MLRDQAVAQIKQILGFRSDKTTEILDALKFQQNELEHEPQLPFFLLVETFALATVIDDERVSLPAGFLREWDEDALWIENPDDKWIALEKDTSKYLRQSTEASGMPIAYSLDGQGYVLFPTPDKVYNLRQTYYKSDTVLDTDIENLWLKHLPYLLIGRAGAVLAASLRDQTGLGIFSQLIASETAKLNSWTTEREMAGRRLVMGGND